MLDDTTGSFALRFALAALVVALALAAFFAVVTFLKRRSPGSLLGTGAFLGAARGKQSRLKVLDSAVIDARRRIVLVRRDNVEHLLMIGGPQDLVIETGIDAAYEPREDVEERSDVRSFRADEAYDSAPRREAPVQRSQQDPDPDDFIFEARGDDDLEPEPARRSADRPASRSAPLRDSLRSMFRRDKPEAKIDTRPDDVPARNIYSEWEEDEDDGLTDADLHLTGDLFDEDELDIHPDEPPTGTIRPVTMARGAALAPLKPVANARPEPAVSAEEAAIARELDNARRRLQIAGPAAPAMPQPAAPQPSAAPSDFDRVLEREMEEKLEAAKRQQQAPPRPVVQQPRRDPNLPRITGASPDQRSIDTGIARIFGETPKSNGER